MPATAPKPKPSRRGVVQRFTGKVGPLPVWAWALLILVAGYLVYRLTGAGTATSPTTDTTAQETTTPVAGDTSVSPPASGQGGAADNLNDTVLASLGGLQSSVDALGGLPGSIDSLAGLIQTTPAFNGGDSAAGSGSQITNDGSTAAPAPAPAKAPAATVARPAARPAAPAKIRYYTFKPGKAPKGRKADEAPAKGPAGTTLHFTKGSGYFYA